MIENGSRQAGHMIVPGYLHGRTWEDDGGPRRQSQRQTPHSKFTFPLWPVLALRPLRVSNLSTSRQRQL
jgi:hypothetical protein